MPHQEFVLLAILLVHHASVGTAETVLAATARTTSTPWVDARPHALMDTSQARTTSVNLVQLHALLVIPLETVSPALPPTYS